MNDSWHLGKDHDATSTVMIPQPHLCTDKGASPLSTLNIIEILRGWVEVEAIMLRIIVGINCLILQ